MDSTYIEMEHDRFEDILRIEKKKNGKKTTRIIYTANCKCGVSIIKTMARVKRVNRNWTKESVLAMNEARKTAKRLFLLHIVNGGVEPG